MASSVSVNNAAAAAVLDTYSSIESLPNKLSIFSAELYALYLALDVSTGSVYLGWPDS